MLNTPSKSGTNNSWQESHSFESVLFLLIVIIETAITFFMLQERRIVGGHDGFQYFYLQYYFLNHAVNYGEIPQWIPFLTHGTVAAWWYIIQGGILQSILLLSAGIWQGFNFLPFFYAGIFVDELLLLTGVWLLGRRFFHSPLTLFFVALSVMGSCIWVLQPWWNFHLYYALPLILYFVHRFLDSGQWRYALLAGNLLFIQSLGNLPYFLPLISLVIFLYFFFFSALNYAEVCRQIKKIRFKWPFFLTSSAIIILFTVLYATMHFGTEQINNYTFRSPDGTSSLDIFLTYGGKATWKAWLEMILGVSPGLDYTLYIGIIGVPLVISGLFLNLRRKHAHFLLTIIVLLLLSSGTFVSVFFYYCWPMMNYFRHLMLIATVIKLLFCFMAGFGLEALIGTSLYRQKTMKISTSLAVSSLLMMGAASVLWHMSGDGAFTTRFLDSMVPEKLYRFLTLADEGVVSSLLVRNAIFAVTTAMILAVMILVENRKRYFCLIVFLTALHAVDIYGFKVTELKMKSAMLNDAAYNVTRFTAMPYRKNRNITFNKNNSRLALFNALPISYGASYWTAHAMCFMDELGNPFKTDHMLLPLDQYMKAYRGLSMHKPSPPPGLHLFSHLEFPTSHPAALKISGATEDKIQFFSRAEMLPSDELVASYISAPGYRGDILFLSPLDENEAIACKEKTLAEKTFVADRRLYTAYQVDAFDSNNLLVTATPRHDGAVWLLYSDVWHPEWRATVNGKPASVYRANLAYKAVKLERGTNKVHFYFKSGWRSAIYALFSLNALVWLAIIVFQVVRILFQGLPQAGVSEKKRWSEGDS